MSRGRRRRGGARRPAAGEGGSGAPASGAEGTPKPQAGSRQGGQQGARQGSRQRQAPQGGEQGPRPAGGESARRSGGRRRRRKSGASRAEPSALEQMADRGPRVLQTLPADGLVAEEIIDNMRDEYGYPATPQEYRLIVRVAPDEAERQNARRRRESPAPGEAPSGLIAGTPDGEPEEDAPDAAAPKEGAPVARRGRLRRRRRGRGRSGGAGDGVEPATGGPRGDAGGDSPGTPGGAEPGGGEPAGD
jgi:hypothetical protein